MASTSLKAAVSWPPDASLTNSLVIKALESLDEKIEILPSTPEDIPYNQKLLQWSTYDAIDHELTYTKPSQVLSCTYVIRKALIRKHYLARCIQNYVTKHPESVLTTSVPRTWDFEIRFAEELDELWGDELWDLGQELDKENTSKWYILKPGMTDRGMGIRLFNTKDDLTSIFEEFEEDSDEDDDEGHEAEAEVSVNDTSVVTSHVRHFVIQEYLQNPVLFDPAEVPLDGSQKPSTNDLRGHKFHLRAYCVASGALSVYFYTRILALFSSSPFSPPSSETDKSVESLAQHLTNTALQLERGEASVRLFDELINCHPLGSPHANMKKPARRPMRGRAMGIVMDPDQPGTLSRETKSEEHVDNVFSEMDLVDIQNQIAEILGQTFKAALDMSVHFQPLPNAFELYGIDFMVTYSPSPNSNRKYQVHILEVNSEPAIENTGPRLTWILEDLFKEMGRHFVSPYINAKQESTWAVGETRDHLRKCLSAEVRGVGGWEKS